MYIKSLNINNFRCFQEDSEPITFNVPDGDNTGSGLNILVGENGTGKTTILEAISYLNVGSLYKILLKAVMRLF